MDPVKIGIIGIGNMGGSHVATIGELKNCRVTAVCDYRPETFENPALPPDAQRFTDDEEFFAKADCEAVIVAVPHYEHVSLAWRALETGRHVLIEKPVSVHKKVALELLEAAKKYPDLRLAAMFNQRTIPAHRKIKQLIDSGELGEIRRVNWIITDWFRTQAYYDSGDWRASWRGEGGGVLLNQCPHQLDLMQWLFGMPSRVTARAAFGKYHDIEVEDEVTALLEYPNGATGVFVTTTGEAPGTNRLEIAAERGRLVLEDGKLQFRRNEIPMSEFCRTSSTRFGFPDRWEILIPAEAGSSHQHRDVISAFADSIRKGTPLVAEAVEGIRGLELGNAMLLSALKNRTVELPLDADEFAAELEKLIATSRWVKPEVRAAATDDFSKSFNK